MGLQSGPELTTERDKWIPEHLKNWKLNRKYDRFKDLTIFRVSTAVPVELPSYVRASRSDYYYYPLTQLSVLHACKGDVSDCETDSAAMGFSLCTKKWFFQGTSEINLIADDERITIAPITWSEDVIEANILVEDFGFSVSTATLQKIANARRVGVQIGIAEFELAHDNLASLRQILTTVKPKAELAPIPNPPPASPEARPNGAKKKSAKG
jgi:hypothetical protein